MNTPQSVRDRTLRLLILGDIGVEDVALKQQLDRAGMPMITRRVDGAPAFREALLAFAPDIVLSAPSVDEFNALAAVALLRAARPVVPLIVVAHDFDANTAVASIRGGAEDLVLTTRLHRLAPAIEAALTVRRPLGALSPRQLEVLRLVSEGQTTSQIARHLGISVKTVETHRGELMKRLDIRNVAGLVRYAMRVGLVLPLDRSQALP